MIWKIILAVVAVAAGTAYMTGGIVWYVTSSLSENPKKRRRAQLMDCLLSLGLATIYVLRAAKGEEPKVAGIMFGLVIPFCLYRVVRLLLQEAES